MNPYPFADETFESFSARLLAISPLTRVDKTRIRHIYSPMPRSSLLLYVDAHLANQGKHQVFDQLVQINQLLNAFLPKKDIEKLDAYARTGGGQHKEKLVRIAESSRGIQSHCLACIEEELEEHGFWYAHRMHSHALLEICDRHHQPLVSRCPDCGFWLNSHFGVRPLRCKECGFVVRSSMIEPISKEKQRMQLRILDLIQAAISGSITGNLCTNSYLAALGLDDAADLPTYRLTKRLVDFYGDEYLRRWYLHPYSKPQFGWPSIYLNNCWPDVNPCMELLLAAMLPDDVRQHVWLNEPERRVRFRRHAVFKLDYSMLKRLLSGQSLKRIAMESGLSTRAISSVRCAYPGVQQRTKSTRCRRRLRILRKRRKRRGAEET